MRIQVTLTPAESKKLLAKAVAAMEPVKKAQEDGLIVIHPSSTTLFLIEELTGKRPEGLWVVGVVFPKGMCISWERQQTPFLPDVSKLAHSWVLEKGVFRTGVPLDVLLDQMGKDDIYVKGANAIDPQGKAGVLYAAPKAGTIGKVIAASKRKGFTILLPIGIEKLIPHPMNKAAKAASQEKTDVAMGIPVGLMPVPGKTVTEIEAIRILSGLEAVAISAGGLGGAEGAITMVITGEEKKVSRALEIIRSCKGAALPEIHPTDCKSCSWPDCHLRGT